MNNDHYFNFLDSADKVIKEHQGPNCFALNDCDGARDITDQVKAARLSVVLQRAIENMDEELVKFEMQFTNSRNAVFWASDYNDVFEGLKKIFCNQKVRSARLPNVNNSYIFRELGMKFFLSEQKIELREEGDVQFFFADMMLSDSGSLLLLNQSNSNLGKMNNANTNIFLTTIDRILPNSVWVEEYMNLTAYKNNGQKQDYILFRGTPNCNNYLFIVDNQRTTLLKAKRQRQILTCLNCGRCNDVCPVFQTIGEEPYNNVFSGPAAHIALPFLESTESYMHVLYVCTLCGRCEEVCPINLPIRDMIIDGRQALFADGSLEKKDHHAMLANRKILHSRSKMNASNFLKRHLLNKYLSSDMKKTRKMPSFNDNTFNKRWEKLSNEDYKAL